MAVLLPSTATILSTPFANRILPLRHHSHAFSPSTKRFLRGSLSVARFGFQPGFIPEPDDAHFAIKELFNRAEDTVVTTAIATAKQDNDLLSLITNFVETVLKVFLSQTSIQLHFYFDSVYCKIETVI
jgi:YidC/Oxa1 family membrane protein insertase